jgi:hypothetical protein
MKRLAPALACSLLAASAVHAGPINPDPSQYGDDIDVGGVFTTAGDLTIAVEAFDFPGAFGGGSEFGFYFHGSDVSLPQNRIAVFTFTDQDLDPDPVLGVQVALVSFAAGLVIDFDAGVGRTFTPVPAGDAIRIGFYLTPSFGGGSLTHIFSQPALNGGLDLFGAFPLLSDAGETLLLAFENPDGLRLAAELVATPIPLRVPEPAPLALLAAGLSLGGLLRVRRSARPADAGHCRPQSS